jgi:hypothetical protein
VSPHGEVQGAEAVLITYEPALHASPMVPYVLTIYVSKQMFDLCCERTRPWVGNLAELDPCVLNSCQLHQEHLIMFPRLCLRKPLNLAFSGRGAILISDSQNTVGLLWPGLEYAAGAVHTFTPAVANIGLT